METKAFKAVKSPLSKTTGILMPKKRHFSSIFITYVYQSALVSWHRLSTVVSASFFYAIINSIIWRRCHLFIPFILFSLRLYSHLRQCLAWNITETCSSEHSSFLTKVFRRRFTPTLCEGIYNLEKDNAGSKNGGGPLKSNKVVFVLIFFFRFGFSQPVG